MLTTENFEKSQEKLDKRGKLGRGAITYDSPCKCCFSVWWKSFLFEREQALLIALQGDSSWKGDDALDTVRG